MVCSFHSLAVRKDVRVGQLLGQNRGSGGNPRTDHPGSSLASCSLRMSLHCSCSVFGIKICAQLCGIITLGQN